MPHQIGAPSGERRRRENVAWVWRGVSPPQLTRGHGIELRDPQPETHFSAFWKPQNAHFYIYMLSVMLHLGQGDVWGGAIAPRVACHNVQPPLVPDIVVWFWAHCAPVLHSFACLYRKEQYFTIIWCTAICYGMLTVIRVLIHRPQLTRSYSTQTDLLTAACLRGTLLSMFVRCRARAA